MTTAVLIALALLAYTYVGYPAAIGLLARLSPWRTPHRPRSGRFCAAEGDGLPACLQRRALPAQEDRKSPRPGLPRGQNRDSHRLRRVYRRNGRPCRAAGGSAVGPRPPPGLDCANGAANRPPSTRWRRRRKASCLLLNDLRQPLSTNAIRAMARALEDRTSAAPPATSCWPAVRGAASTGDTKTGCACRSRVSAERSA